MTAKKAASESGETRDFLEAFLPILKKTKEISIFRLPERLYAGNRDMTLENLKPLPQTTKLSESQKEFIVSRLSNKSSYLFEYLKAMRFYADYGVIFQGVGVPPNVLLISVDFRGARLVLEEPFSARDAIVNLDPVFAELLEQLKKSFQ
ncbi:MAG: hypothetical protein WBX25_22990 [Rhodomicrobium sp.]